MATDHMFGRDVNNMSLVFTIPGSFLVCHKKEMLKQQCLLCRSLMGVGNSLYLARNAHHLLSWEMCWQQMGSQEHCFTVILIVKKQFISFLFFFFLAGVRGTVENRGESKESKECQREKEKRK